MTKNEFKNSAPLAPTSTGAGSAPKTIAPKPEKGTLVKKKNTAAGGATGTTGNRSHVKATGGASYGIKAKMPAHTVICCSWHLTGRWFFRPPPKAKSATRIYYRSGTPVHRACIAFLSGFFERGMGGNVGAVTALEYVMGGNFVERYRKKISGSSQKLSCIL